MSNILPYLVGTYEYNVGMFVSMHLIEGFDPYSVFASKMYVPHYAPTWIFYHDVVQKVAIAFDTVPVCVDDFQRYVHRTRIYDYGRNKRPIDGLHYNLFTKLRVPVDMQLSRNS